MAHPLLKPTREIKINYNPQELDYNQIPEESEKFAKEYLTSKNTWDGDIIIMLEDRIIFGYDYVNHGRKIILPEVNPVTIFYSMQ